MLTFAIRTGKKAGDYLRKIPGVEHNARIERDTRADNEAQSSIIAERYDFPIMACPVEKGLHPMDVAAGTINAMEAGGMIFSSVRGTQAHPTGNELLARNKRIHNELSQSS